MCLIVVAYGVDHECPFVVAANRDEYYSRPTLQAHFWPLTQKNDYDSGKMQKRLFAGQDIQSHGTWLGITTNGRFAAVTNYRSGNNDKQQQERKSVRSRGKIVSDFLQSNTSAENYVTYLLEIGKEYSGYNVLVGDTSALYYYSNRSNTTAGILPRKLEPGHIYGLSNASLDTPWPKLQRSKTALADILHHSKTPCWNDVLQFLTDEKQDSDDDLPQTGVSLELERLLSSIFIASDEYGTRCSTLIHVARTGQAVFIEQSYGKQGQYLNKIEVMFQTSAIPGGGLMTSSDDL